MAESLLPENATATEVNAELVAATRIEAIPVPLNTLMDPLLLQEDIIPWLAWAVNALEWHSDLTVDKQRAAIAASVQLHNILGTPQALKTGLATIGLDDANVIELPVEIYNGTHNYDGSIDYSHGPYLFDIQVSNPGDLYSVDEIEQAIKTFANVRSHLRNLFLANFYYDGTQTYNGAENYDGDYN